MKVLFINSVYNRGSTGRIVKDLADVVIQNGGDYRIICGRGCHKIDDERVFDVSSAIGIISHATLSRLFDTSGFHSNKATKRVIEFIDDYSPDIINLHNLHGYYLNVEMLFDYLKNKYKGKIVWTLHDCWAFTGHCAYYTHAKCDKWETGCCKCPQKRMYPKSLLKDNSYNNYLRKQASFSNVPNLYIVTPSKWLANEIERSFLKHYTCFVINNGIDLSVFRPSVLPKERDKYQLLNVSNGVDTRKGFNDLIKLMSLLPDKYHLVIVGVDKKVAKQSSERIKFVYKTNSVNELVDYYSRSSFLINPTYEDNFPTINIESLACGTPVIAYNSGGASEAIDSLSGVSIKTGRIDEVATAILTHNFKESDCLNRSKLFDKRVKFLEYFSLFTKLLKEE